MNKSRTRFVISLVAVIVIAIVGYLWWQQSQIGPYGRREIVTYVDRGLTDDFREHVLAQIEEKKQALAQAEAAGERDIGLILELGNLYYQLGELANSVEYYDEILSTHPNDDPALENKGQSLLEMGDYENAEEAWLKALETHQYEVTYLRLVELYNTKLTEKQDQVQPLLETAITNLGQQPGLMLALGHWYRDNGQLDEAISHYEIVLKLQPYNQDVAKEIQKLRDQKVRLMQQGLDK